MPRRPLFLGLLLLLALAPCSAAAQDSIRWFRQPQLNGAYDLSKTRILIIAANSFNPGETVEMAECWKQWGAKVEFAGSERTVTGENEGLPPGSNPPILRVDLPAFRSGSFTI